MCFWHLLHKLWEGGARLHHTHDLEQTGSDGAIRADYTSAFISKKKQNTQRWWKENQQREEVWLTERKRWRLTLLRRRGTRLWKLLNPAEGPCLTRPQILDFKKVDWWPVRLRDSSLQNVRFPPVPQGAGQDWMWSESKLLVISGAPSLLEFIPMVPLSLPSAILSPNLEMQVFFILIFNEN